MIFVNRNSVPIPEIFTSREIAIAKRRLEEFYERPEGSRSQERFSRPFQPQINKELIHSLRILFKNKCAYCESPLPAASTIGTIENFRPINNARGFDKDFSRDHYWWLTFDWENLYLACENCNRYKSTWFPTKKKRGGVYTPITKIRHIEEAFLVDPCFDKPEKHLSFDEMGSVYELTERGKVTIDILKLNRSDLILARRNALNELFGESEFVFKAVKRKTITKELISVAREWKDILSDNSDKPYVGALKSMLFKWLRDSPEIIDFLSSIEEDGKNASIKKIDVQQYITPPPKKTLKSRSKKSIESKIDSIRHIYIEKIEIRNFKCFSHLELDFGNNNGIAESKIIEGNPLIEPWVLFLGENGVGKSSLLKAIVIGLTGKEYIEDLAVSGKDLLKHGEKKGYIKVFLVGAAKPIEVFFEEKKITTNLNQPIVNILAYNSIRLKPKIGKMIPEIREFYGAKAKNLFDYTFSLVDADNWLATLPKNIFNRAALTLKDLMLLDNEDTLRIENDHVVVERGNDIFYIDELSDGYKSIFYLAVDIMATLAGENTEFEVSEGMVLIDEIGTHLHPRWRMEVVGRLRKAFPQIRFVVTTHEPLCLRGLVAGETVVLTKNENKEIIALTDLPDPSELRVDQLLTSDFFGLKSTIDPETEKLFDEYYHILALDEKDRTEKEKNRLLVLSGLVPRIKHLGDNLREELVYYVIDELLANKTRGDGLKNITDLKVEAIRRVESLWKTIENKNE